MKIYWTISSVPELAELAKNERRRLWRRYFWKIFQTRWSPWAGLIMVAAVVQFGRSLNEAWGGIIGGLIGGFIFVQVLMEALHYYVRQENELNRNQTKRII